MKHLPIQPLVRRNFSGATLPATLSISSKHVQAFRVFKLHQDGLQKKVFPFVSTFCVLTFSDLPLQSLPAFLGAFIFYVWARPCFSCSCFDDPLFPAYLLPLFHCLWGFQWNWCVPETCRRKGFEIMLMQTPTSQHRSTQKPLREPPVGIGFAHPQHGIAKIVPPGNLYESTSRKRTSCGVNFVMHKSWQEETPPEPHPQCVKIQIAYSPRRPSIVFRGQSSSGSLVPAVTTAWESMCLPAPKAPWIICLYYDTLTSGLHYDTRVSTLIVDVSPPIEKYV